MIQPISNGQDSLIDLPVRAGQEEEKVNSNNEKKEIHSNEFSEKQRAQISKIVSIAVATALKTQAEKKEDKKPVATAPRPLNTRKITWKKAKKMDNVLVKRHMKKKSHIKKLYHETTRNMLLALNAKKWRVYKVGNGVHPALFTSADKKAALNFIKGIKA